MFNVPLIALACVARLVAAQSGVVGSATGFASGVTGGGSATPSAPADIKELTSWLKDDVARVILIDKEFNFLESEGTKTENGCRPDSNTCGAKGQDSLPGPDWCSASYPTVSVTYDVAATKPIDIKSNKSIVGVGSMGVIRGKGFRVVHGAKNIIFQNFHITDLNPQYIWGGDAIQLRGSDLIWIDHMKISLVGRQMLVTEGAGRVTISNSELDGQTSWSASCNGQHYWTMMFIGTGDQITLANNWIHNTSGRSPKVGGTTTLHAVNNFFDTNGGTAKPKLTSGLFNVPAASDAASCSAALGRACEANSLSGSGSFGSFKDTSAITAVGKGTSIWKAIAASGVSALKTSAGVGKLSSSASSAVVAEAKVAPVASSVSSSTVQSSKATSAVASSATSKAAAVATTASSKVAVATTAAAKQTTAASGADVARWGRCGGSGYTGATACESGTKCAVLNDYYSQCQ